MVANINRRTRIVLMDEGVREEKAICQLSQEDLEHLALVATGEAEAGLTRVIPLDRPDIMSRFDDPEVEIRRDSAR